MESKRKTFMKLCIISRSILVPHEQDNYNQGQSAACVPECIYLWLGCDCSQCARVFLCARSCPSRGAAVTHVGVCAYLVCVLFWLWGCWCCPIMSSIISPVNTAKSSCPWEKLWKGECQYWQTNKFWQRGDFWAIGQGCWHGPVGMSYKANARWRCFVLESHTCEAWCSLSKNKEKLQF